jgi:hypothetical protein
VRSLAIVCYSLQIKSDIVAVVVIVISVVAEVLPEGPSATFNLQETLSPIKKLEVTTKLHRDMALEIHSKPSYDMASFQFIVTVDYLQLHAADQPLHVYNQL